MSSIEDDEPEIDAVAPSAADPQALREAKKRRRREKDERVAFWRMVLASEVGRREIWSILADVGTFASVFVCGPNGFPQPDATMFKAGQKDFGERLHRSLMRIDRDGVWKMHDECDPDFAVPKRGKPKTDSGEDQFWLK